MRLRILNGLRSRPARSYCWQSLKSNANNNHATNFTPLLIRRRQLDFLSRLDHRHESDLWHKILSALKQRELIRSLAAAAIASSLNRRSLSAGYEVLDALAYSEVPMSPHTNTKVLVTPLDESCQVKERVEHQFGLQMQGGVFRGYFH